MPDFFGKLKSGAEKVAFEADKMARVNKAQGELNQLKRQIEAQYTKLGEMTYRKIVNQEAESPEVSGICQNITDLQQQATVKSEEVQRINAEQYTAPGAQAPAPAPQPVQPAPAGATLTPESSASVQSPAAATTPETAQVPMAANQAQTRTCPNCGKEMAASVKFCPDCGTKMS
ncbi:MAG: zinc-ribbon domain-containing protein [Omnitrophica WOR_2 bacterium]